MFLRGMTSTGATSTYNNSVMGRQSDATRLAELRAAERLANAAGPRGRLSMGGFNTRSSSRSSGSGGFGGGGATPAAAPVVVEQEKLDPWSTYRGSSGDRLAQMSAGGDPSDFYRDKLQQMSQGEFNSSDPSYDFRFRQGQKATERSLAARGLLNSGNAAELQEYGQQVASQEYQAQFDRMLSGLSGVSQQHDTQMQQLMQMAGVNVSPSSPWETAATMQNAQTNAQRANNDYAVGMANAGTNAAQVANSSSSMSAGNWTASKLGGWYAS